MLDLPTKYTPDSTPSGSSSVPVLPIAALDIPILDSIRALRARVKDAQASLTYIKSSISFLQMVASTVEKSLLADMRELTRFELIHTSRLAENEEPVAASDGFGSPSVH
nr:uncharacterized protein LOC109163356 [Ipomoea batatas]